jgi:hypothetical protein
VPDTGVPYSASTLLGIKQTWRIRTVMVSRRFSAAAEIDVSEGHANEGSTNPKISVERPISSALVEAASTRRAHSGMTPILVDVRISTTDGVAN